MSYFPDLDIYNLDPDTYLEHLKRAKQAVDIPIIASLNANSSGSWINYAKKIEQTGADALELNCYNLPTDINVTGAELEETYVRLLQDVRAAVKIPLALKLSPFFTSLPNMAKRFVEAGADALVLFNRFYQPDLLCDTLQVVPTIELSTSLDLRLPLRWIAILYGRLNVDFALTSGVHSADDVVKAIMAGANVTMMASEILAHGIDRLTTIAEDLSRWMEEHEYKSISSMRGSLSQSAVAEPAVFERAHYMRALNSFDRYLP
jgi:dihydroorotate dehydrogenase (fumarate)